MGKSFFELDKTIRLKIEQESELALQSSKVSSTVEKYVLEALRLILDKYERTDLMDMLYTIIKELAINAVKANQKRIFFEEAGLDIAAAADYEEGMQRFKLEFSDEMNEVYGRKALARGIYVLIVLQHDETGLTVEVINNTPILSFEERRLREKMKKSMAYHDLAEFYLDNADNTEGAGLGLAMIVILLKGANIDPAYFRIFTLPDRTVARLELPFTEDFVSRRQANARS